MTDAVLEPRILETRDWATIVFLIAFVLIAMAKSFFETRFNEYLRLIVSDKYIKVYRDSSHLMSGFTILLFVVQLVALAFFIQLVLSHFNYVQKTDWIVFIQIFTFVAVFVLGKYLIEKIIATSFKMDEFVEQFNLQKVSYRTYIGLLVLPVDIVLFYNDNLPDVIVYLTIIAVLSTNMLTYLISLKNYQNFLISRLFYFILYLCALEIAPYYFMYYWFTKS